MQVSILVWLFDNTGKSVFITILFHTTLNVSFGVLPTNLVVSSLLILITAAIVTFSWGPETMAKFRWKKADDSG
jgi:hypothetical protein